MVAIAELITAPGITFRMFKALASKKINIMLYVWAILVAYSRVYLGVHFPIDIFVGILIGVTFANLYFILSKKVIKKLFI